MFVFGGQGVAVLVHIRDITQMLHCIILLWLFGVLCTGDAVCTGDKAVHGHPSDCDNVLPGVGQHSSATSRHNGLAESVDWQHAPLLPVPFGPGQTRLTQQQSGSPGHSNGPGFATSTGVVHGVAQLLRPAASGMSVPSTSTDVHSTLQLASRDLLQRLAVQQLTDLQHVHMVQQPVQAMISPIRGMMRT